EVLWTRNITIRMGVVNTNTIPVLLRMIQACKLDPTLLITHHYPLEQIVEAYEVFKNAAREQAIKIVLTNTSAPAAEGEATLIREIVAQVLARL
ncbi:MAG TPA: hypothetical protein PK954_12045, partial [Anaerolineales bacterium]|nr:hypothetical protein [Anaerolineales bacterium]